MKERVKIDPELFIGDGTERLCYLHPGNRAWCIKIPRSSSHTKQHRHDLKIYNKLAKRENGFRHIAAFRGTVITERGEGLLFETVRNGDGSVAKSLLHYLYNAPDRIDEEMISALRELENFIKKERIILKDPSPSNLLYQQNGSGGRFVIIDGIDLPAVPLFADFKISKQWEKVLRRLYRESGDNPAVRKLLAASWPNLFSQEAQ
ncbi:YrbL family protein [Hydrogenimonas urashimensis]|uniref:YrbL family protein n=1 Tax=Hydrogenimonas urashimensis TaxID=2740515 RepID=UPI00191613CA|nr:YrbL family protein [Hydrogenimonas urashimensis]